MPFNIGPIELLIVLFIVLLVLGPSKLPEVGNALGKTIREFRKASSDVQESLSVEPVAAPAAAAAPARPVAPSTEATAAEAGEDRTAS